jgi:hypothetical protein
VNIPDSDLAKSYVERFGDFDNSAVLRVIGDLGLFCGAMVSPESEPKGSGLPQVRYATGLDPMSVGIRIGRREVFDRICAMLSIDQSQAWRVIERANQLRRAANG